MKKEKIIGYLTPKRRKAFGITLAKYVYDVIHGNFDKYLIKDKGNADV